MKRTLISSMIFLTVAFAAIAGDNPRVEMDTTKGKIILELAADKAPKTVKNFLAYVDAGFYDGIITKIHPQTSCLPSFNNKLALI